MDDSEKLLALKKAYADIILNTAKEAAARVLVSERKATRFQQELASSKDEALRMLLRLKQMLDSKVKEAELTSLSQQKKIDELEAQLQEAEDIVSNLRAELREAETKLENVTNHTMHPPLEQNVEGEAATQEYYMQDNRLDPYERSIQPLPDSHVEPVSVSDSRAFCVSHDHTHNCYIHNPDFASIVIRRKEPQLYRNGCTQRIHAFERNLFNGNMSVSGNLDNVHDETMVSIHEEGIAVDVTTNAKADTICEKEKPDELKAVKADADPVKVPACERKRNFIKALRSRLRANRARKRNKASCIADAKDSPCLLDNNDSLRVNSFIECGNEAQKDLVGVNEEGKSTTVTTNAKADAICGQEKPNNLEVVKMDADLVKVPVHKKKRLTLGLHPDPVKKTNDALYPSDAKCSPLDSSMVCKKEAEKDLMSLSFVKVPTDKAATIEHSKSQDDIENGGVFLNVCSAQKKIKDEKKFLEKSDLTRQESMSTESLEVSSCRADAEQANGSPDKPDPKASDLGDKVSRHPANDKFLKYTFQRKRKKESVRSANADWSLENGSLKKSVEKQNDNVEPQKSCPVTESSRDSRRLAQVARQLISLSEKKWWQ
ncbi:hypothetical protein Lalb_Chr12g0201291 [Lupinus albus]|uniref:Uncharacterized protein n=1 Tax=Lupinus albus TaxID=3870 RepID=A0A6A4PM41_LUPAL|nr:hypothetical protein Lalb_Chr12g0201291 [Lupinus albus]